MPETEHEIEISLEKSAWDLFHEGKFAKSYSIYKKLDLLKGGESRALFDSFNSQFMVATELDNPDLTRDCYAWFASEYEYLSRKLKENPIDIPTGMTNYFRLIEAAAIEAKVVPSNPAAVAKTPVITRNILAESISTQPGHAEVVLDALANADMQNSLILPQLLNETGTLLEENGPLCIAEAVKCHRLAIKVAELAGRPKSELDAYSEDYIHALDSYMQQIFNMGGGSVPGRILAELARTDHYTFAIAANRLNVDEDSDLTQAIRAIDSVFTQLGNTTGSNQ